MIKAGSRVCLANGQKAVVKRVMDRGVIELVSPSGAFLCFSHTDCVQARTATQQVQTDFWPELAHPSMVTLARLHGAAADARSTREDAAAAACGSALGKSALNPDSFSSEGHRG